MKHNLTIVIINYNGNKDTRECLRSLERTDMKNIRLHIIIVDNGSERFSYDKNEFKHFTIEVLLSEKNLGFSGGNNLGMKHALANGATYIMLLNNDTIVSDTFLTDFINTAIANETNGIYVPKIYFAAGYEYHKKTYKKDELGHVLWYAGGYIDWANLIGINRGVDEVDHGQYNDIEKTELATGCCMLIHRRVLEQVGLFDERYFLYYEDSDYSMRVREANFSILYTPNVHVWHKNASSSGGSGSGLQDYYISRNRMLFGMTYAPFRTKVSLIRESLRILMNGRTWQKKGIQDFYKGKFGKADHTF